MTSPIKRTEDRLNLRISDRNVLDDMRITAESEGLTLPSWAKATLIQNLKDRANRNALFYQLAESTFVIRNLMEREHSQRDIQIARQVAADKIAKGADDED